MTRVTIDLPPEIYAQLQREAQRRGADEQMLAQELLTNQLRATTPDAVPLALEMAPQIRALVATMHPDDLIAPGTATAEAVVALLRSWTAADAEDDDAGAEPWEDVMRAIDAHRTSARPHFPDLEPSA
jgi:hypothetical protein